jgi:hypothetical protein
MYAKNRIHFFFGGSAEARSAFRQIFSPELKVGLFAISRTESFSAKYLDNPGMKGIRPAN